MVRSAFALSVLGLISVPGIAGDAGALEGVLGLLGSMASKGTNATATGGGSPTVGSSQGGTTGGSTEGGTSTNGTASAGDISAMGNATLFVGSSAATDVAWLDDIPTYQYGPNITKLLCNYNEADTRNADYVLTCAAKTAGANRAAWIGAVFYNEPMTKRIMLQFGPEDFVEAMGEFQTTVTIPKASDDGLWSLGFADQGAFYGLEVVDEAGGRRSYEKAQAVADMGDQLQLTLKVTSVDPATKSRLVPFDENAEIATGPGLVGFACSDTAVQAMSDTKGVVCTTKVFPDAAGIGTTTAYLVGPTGRSIVPFQFTEQSTLQASSSTNSSTSYLITTVGAIPPWVESGVYTMQNRGALTPRTTSKAGTIVLFPATRLTVAAPVLQVSATGDSKAPTLDAFYCSQGQSIMLDAQNDVTVTCLIRATDDFSGISYVGLHFVSPSRQSSMEFSFAPGSAGLGNPIKDANYLVQPVRQVAETASVTLPPSTEPGPWTLARATAADNAGNVYDYRTNELDQTNVQTYFLVQGLSRTFSIQPRAGSPTDGDNGGQKTTSAAPSSRVAGFVVLSVAVAAALISLVSYSS